MFPDDILNLGKNVAIAVNPHERPHKLQPLDYWLLQDYLTAVAKKIRPAPVLPDLSAFDHNPDNPASGGPKGKAGGQRGSSPPPPPSGPMGRAEALAAFELKEGASTTEIKTAYKRMMAKVHPDQGGSNYFAKQLNEAREVLLGK
jgi:hypothetical protein